MSDVIFNNGWSNISIHHEIEPADRDLELAGTKLQEQLLLSRAGKTILVEGQYKLQNSYGSWGLSCGILSRKRSSL